MTEDCINILLAMPEFDRDKYFRELDRKGYVVEKRIDSKGNLCGYTLGLGATVIKASDLDNGHRLLASRLQQTWKNLHKNDIRITKPVPASVIQEPKPTVQPPEAHVITPLPETPKTEQESAVSLITINVDGKNVVCTIPDMVRDIFFTEAELPDDVLWSKVEDITHTAILLFCGMIDDATTISMSCGGGGGDSNDKGWGRDKDEDDLVFARRCLAHAARMHIRRVHGLHR